MSFLGTQIRQQVRQTPAEDRIFDLSYLDPFALDNTYDGHDQKIFHFDGSAYVPPAPYYKHGKLIQPRPPNVLDATYDPGYPLLEHRIPHQLPKGHSIQSDYGYLIKHKREIRYGILMYYFAYSL